MDKKQIRMALYVVGGVFTAFGAYKAYIDGFYPSEMPMVLGALAIGVVCLYIGSKIKVATDDEA
jgi:hypothetical protein